MKSLILIAGICVPVAVAALWFWHLSDIRAERRVAVALSAMQPARLPVQKGGDAFAQRQRSQLAGVEVAGELSDHDLDEAITGAGMLGPAPDGYRKINHEARAGAGMRLP